MNPDSEGIYVGASYQAPGGHDIVPIHPSTIDTARQWLTQALDAALAYASLGRIDASALLQQAERGEVLILFVVHRDTLQVRGVAALELFDSVSGTRVAHVAALAGEDLETWLERFIEVGEALVREQGAGAITVLGRPGWRQRLQPYGYERVAVMLAKSLEDPTP